MASNSPRQLLISLSTLQVSDTLSSDPWQRCIPAGYGSFSAASPFELLHKRHECLDALFREGVVNRSANAANRCPSSQPLFQVYLGDRIAAVVFSRYGGGSDETSSQANCHHHSTGSAGHLHGLIGESRTLFYKPDVSTRFASAPGMGIRMI